eukprot:CAMPEP_0202346078 /NCGR_PEP_ID=MMETSP1126-20121109/5026_1 /ASSEMBLY_ACC=CAM_ASM_000457 /TAXON_ID=3047 /ORGANISM="Dunaliella tertiolecta, Strain CCMP1320" /LENGTH=162 /DNA_ID=CAMNT_0048937441 /DNA_START=513 /DNA_END=1001 /DNA_ORIENTATION=-
MSNTQPVRKSTSSKGELVMLLMLCCVHRSGAAATAGVTTPNSSSCCCPHWLTPLAHAVPICCQLKAAAAAAATAHVSIYLYLTKPMSLAYSRKHWRQMLMPYLRIRPWWLPHTRHDLLPEPMPVPRLGWQFHTFSNPMLIAGHLKGKSADLKEEGCRRQACS